MSTSSQITLGLLPNSDGSAQVTVGSTKVVVSVTGPIEPKPRQAMANVASLEVVVRPVVGLGATREKFIEDKLRGILQRVIVRHQYPRQLIQVVVQILTTDEPSEYTCLEMSVALEAMFYALVDANIPLFSSFVAQSVAVVGDDVVFTPSGAQLQKSSSHHVFCYSIIDGNAKDLLFVDSNGDFDDSSLYDLIAQSAQSASAIHQKQRQLIQEKLNRDFIWS